MNYLKILPVAVTLLVSTPIATAQLPVPFPIRECAAVGTTAITEEDNYRKSEFTIPGGVVFTTVPDSLCSVYAYTGWEETMKLHLGKGSSEYLDLIEMAVKVWNETVTPRSGDPLIEIVERWPENPTLPESFWSDTEEPARSNLEDDESVIYFKTDPEDESKQWGLTWVQWQNTGYNRRKMVEADIYINTTDEEEVSPDVLVLTKPLFDVGDQHGAYAVINKTYAVILHELGHAIGLKHIPVSGNIMSRDFGAGGLDQWSAPLALDLLKTSNPKRHKFVSLHSSVFPYMLVDKRNEDYLERVDFFTPYAKLGEQEKMALLCIYEY